MLILGGTGAMGAHLVQELKNSHWQVMVTSRSERKSEANITYIKGNAHQTEFLQSLLDKHFDVVVDFMAYTTSEFESRYKTLLSSCRQYVYLSSSRAYNDSKEPITEDAPLLINTCGDAVYLSTDEYALGKGRQENLLRNSGFTNYTIIRPYITYGEQRLQLGVLEKEEWLYRVLKGRTIVFSSDIAKKQTTLTYGRDLSKALIPLLGNEATLGEAFHITVDQPVLWSEALSIYVEEIERFTGKKVKVFMQEHSHNMNLSDRKWQVVYDRLFNRIFNNQKIKQYSNTDNFVQPHEGLRSCIQACMTSPKFNAIHWREEAYYDRLTGEWARPNEFTSCKTAIKYYLCRLFF